MPGSSFHLSRRLLLAGSALAVARPGAAGAQSRSLTVGVQGFPDSLETGPSSFANLNLHYQTMDPLVLRDDIGNNIPGLATAWTPLDATSWRFDLRKNVKFHDGKPFTAADVKFTLDYILAPTSTYGTKSRIAQIRDVEIKDDHTVVLHTKGPFPTLVNGLGDIPIEPKHYVEQVGRAGMNAKPMGTGPFRFGRWVPADRYELTAFPEYWGGRPPMDNLLMRQIPEGSTRVAALMAGEAQIIEEVPVDLIPVVQRSPRGEVASVESTVGLIITFDTRKPPFNDKRVRQALNLAVDKKKILDRLLAGQGTILDGQILTANTFGYNQNLKPFGYDPRRAKELLAEAGYPNGFTTSITTRSGKYLSDTDLCNAIAAMFGEIGVKTQVNVVEQGVYSRMATAQDMGPMHMVGWYSLGDADFALVWFTEGSKRAFWKNDEFEKLFVSSRATVDEKERLKGYARMTEIMREEAPCLFLYGLPSIYAKAKTLKSWSPPSDKILRLAKAVVA